MGFTVTAVPSETLATPVLLSEQLTVSPYLPMDNSTTTPDAGHFRPQYPRKSLVPGAGVKRASSSTSPRKPFVPAHAITISFTIYAETAPALKSAVEEISNEIGERLVGPHSFDREEALSDAAMALGSLRAAVNAAVPAGHPHYDR